MSWSTLAVFLSFIIVASTINRSVYKIVLTQKGYTQFVQYDVETPPIREFTFCMWMRLYNFDKDQTLFSYIVNGNNRVVRLWLDSGGHYMKVSFNGRTVSSVPVELTKDVWRHVCLSYQSDFGAWALYIDSRLISCEASQNIYRFIIPKGGSVIVGYGTDENGTGRGLEGEIYGVNLILVSTIERNYTMKIHPQYAQKSFTKNKINGPKNMKYIVLKDLQSEEIQTVVKTTLSPPPINKSRSFIKVSTPYNFLEHFVGNQQTATANNLITNKLKLVSSSKEKEIIDLALEETPRPVGGKKGQTFWNIVNDPGHVGKYKNPTTTPPIAEYELPLAAPASGAHDYFVKKLTKEQPPVETISIHKLTDDPEPKLFTNPSKHLSMDEISEYELPPPPELDANVYGQWTSSRYAGSVLNYLKSINFYNKDKKVPSTIPLFKTSDLTHPYATDFRSRVVRPPTNIQRKSMMTSNLFRNQYIQPSPIKHYRLQKREAKFPEINVKILETDIRGDIMKSHAKTRPKHVEISSRGINKKIRQNKLHGNKESHHFDKNYNHNKIFNSKPTFMSAANFNNDHIVTNFDLHKSNSLFNVLPFLKSVEYFTGDNEEVDTNNIENSNDMYSKSFSNANKWHNIKSYNNDFTPRQAPVDGKTDFSQKLLDINKRHPSVLLKYKADTNRVVQNKNDDNMKKGIRMAMDVSNQSNNNKDQISILKYNHGFLPGHGTKRKNKNIQNSSSKSLVSSIKDNFNEKVKLGNTLNEKLIIGVNVEQAKRSFIGGDEKVPDINRYRSDIDNVTENVPGSLKAKVCKNVELYDNILYIHSDGSIDMTHILSPVKEKNIGIEFIVQNYKKCSLEESPLENNNLLLIDWNRTPVRLFGGPKPKQTKDLCGFF